MKKKVNKSDAKHLSTNKVIKWQYILISILPIYAFYSILGEYSVNIPILDDWDAILGFTINWTDANSLEKLKLVFSQHNEHRIVISRAIYALYFSINGDIDFINLGVIANLQLLIIFGVLTYFSSKFVTDTWPLFSIFIALCVFDPSNYENSMMAMAGMANYGVIMLFLLSLMLYSFTKFHFIAIAAFFQTLCIFSNGNGVIAGLVLTLYCFAKGDRTKLKISLLTFICSTILYFTNYTKTNNDLIGKSITTIAEFFFRLIGGHFGSEYRILASIIISIIAIIQIYLLVKKRKEINKEAIPFFAILLFIILSAGSISVFRSAEEDKIELYSYSSRYLIYAHLYAIVVFLLFIQQFEKTKFRLIATAIIGFIFIKAYTENYKFGENMFEIYSKRAVLNKYYYPNQDKVKIIEFKSCEKKIYCLEKNRNLKAIE